MRRVKQYQFYFVYRTVCTINSKIYIGEHSTDDLNDGYIGSGIYNQVDVSENSHFHNAVRKYKYENFKREILEFCETREQLNEREKFWIKELDAVNSPIYYNITKGGDGGDTITNHPNREDIIKRSSITRSRVMLGHIVTEETRQNIRITLSKTLEKRLLQTCPHCGFESKNKDTMKGFHFDNCKQNPSYISKKEQRYYSPEPLVCPYCNYESRHRSSMSRIHFDNCKHKQKVA